MRALRILVTGLLVAFPACRESGPRGAQEPAGDTLPAAADSPNDAGGDRPAGAAASAPASPGPLIAEIRSGIQRLPAEVEADPVAARRRAVDLYVTRMEAIERGWGPGGSAAPDSTVAQAVLAAEESFHELMAVLNRPTSPDSAEVVDFVTGLEARLEEVERAAARAP